MDNYKEVKNYINNELKITKEDIQEIIQREIKQQIERLIKDDSFIRQLVINHVNYIFREKEYEKPTYTLITDINDYIYQETIHEICKRVHDDIKIKVKLKANNLEIKEIKSK